MGCKREWVFGDTHSKHPDEMEVGLYADGKGNSLREKPGGSVGCCMELRRDSCELSFGIVICRVNLSLFF